MDDFKEIVLPIIGIIIVIILGIGVLVYRHDEAYSSGQQAHRKGIPASANPHAGDYPWGQCWLDGWESVTTQSP